MSCPRRILVIWKYRVANSYVLKWAEILMSTFLSQAAVHLALRMDDKRVPKDILCN